MCFSDILFKGCLFGVVPFPLLILFLLVVRFMFNGIAEERKETREEVEKNEDVFKAKEGQRCSHCGENFEGGDDNDLKMIMFYAKRGRGEFAIKVPCCKRCRDELERMQKEVSKKSSNVAWKSCLVNVVVIGLFIPLYLKIMFLLQDYWCWSSDPIILFSIPVILIYLLNRKYDKQIRKCETSIDYDQFFAASEKIKKYRSMGFTIRRPGGEEDIECIDFDKMLLKSLSRSLRR